MNEQMKKDLPTWESEYLAMVNDLSRERKNCYKVLILDHMKVWSMVGCTEIGR